MRKGRKKIRRRDTTLDLLEKYKNLVESLNELVYSANPKEFFATYVNKAVEKFYGYSTKEWLNDPSLWENLIHPDDKERVLAEFKEAQQNTKNAVIQYRIIDRDKTVRWVEDSVSWEKGRGGKVVSMNGVMSDITKRKKTEETEQASQDAVKNFYRNILMLQEQDKKRISRDLHDETGQVIIALGASLNIIEKELKGGSIGKALEVLNENRKHIQEIAAKMKSMAITLRPPALDILGLSAVLREYFSQCTKSYPIKIEFNENLKDVKLKEDIEITLYRIVQEAIYNILKHSAATIAKVNLTFSRKELRLFIEDNGRGFNIEEYNRRYDAAKMGLRGIKERVGILNGTLAIESSPGRGTKMTIALPLDNNSMLQAP